MSREPDEKVNYLASRNLLQQVSFDHDPFQREFQIQQRNKFESLSP